MGASSSRAWGQRGVRGLGFRGFRGFRSLGVLGVEGLGLRGLGVWCWWSQPVGIRQKGIYLEAGGSTHAGFQGESLPKPAFRTAFDRAGGED